MLEFAILEDPQVGDWLEDVEPVWPLLGAANVIALYAHTGVVERGVASSAAFRLEGYHSHIHRPFRCVSPPHDSIVIPWRRYVVSPKIVKARKSLNLRAFSGCGGRI